MTEMLRGVVETLVGPSRTKTEWSMTLSTDAQTQINKLINEFMRSSLRCKSMQYYFKCQTQSLFGIADLHLWSSVSDGIWSRALIEYMNVRGAIVEFDSIDAPESHEWGDVASSIECMLRSKQLLYQMVLKLYKTAVDKSTYDPHLANFIEVNFARPMVNVIRKLGILYTQATLAAREEGVGVYEFNKDVEKNLLKIVTVNKLVRPDKFSVVF